MVEVKKILVPTDFSEEAECAYTHAQELANRRGAIVDFIHVVPLLKYFSESMNKLEMPLNLEDDLYPHVLDGAKHKMRELMEDYIKEANRGEVHSFVKRKPARAIAEFAAEHKYDMVVMAGRGEHGTELFRGSTSEKVIRLSEVPVFTVDSRLKPEGLKQILVPTDASTLSFTCFPLALTLAEIYDAEITLLHVLELHGSLSESIEWNPRKTEKSNIYDKIIDQLDDYLIEEKLHNVLIQRSGKEFEDEIEITEGTSKTAIPLHTVIEKGVSAHYEINEYALEHSDVVVMTTHGHTGLARFFLGSTTEKVAQYLDLPVLTVKPHSDKLG